MQVKLIAILKLSTTTIIIITIITIVVKIIIKIITIITMIIIIITIMVGTVRLNDSTTTFPNVTAPTLPPRFTERLVDCKVKEGGSARLAVGVAGKPEPKVTWYRQNKKIVSSNDFKISRIGNVHTLIIPEVFHEDAGRYSVVIENDAGQSNCSAELIVEGDWMAVLLNLLNVV